MDILCACCVHSVLRGTLHLWHKSSKFEQEIGKLYRYFGHDFPAFAVHSGMGKYGKNLHCRDISSGMKKISCLVETTQRC